MRALSVRSALHLNSQPIARVVTQGVAGVQVPNIILKNPGPGPSTRWYDADPGTSRVFIFIPVPVPMEVIPARYRPEQNFDPGRPLVAGLAVEQE